MLMELVFREHEWLTEQHAQLLDRVADHRVTNAPGQLVAFGPGQLAVGFHSPVFLLEALAEFIQVKHDVVTGPALGQNSPLGIEYLPAHGRESHVADRLGFGALRSDVS